MNQYDFRFLMGIILWIAGVFAGFLIPGIEGLILCVLFIFFGLNIMYLSIISEKQVKIAGYLEEEHYLLKLLVKRMGEIGNDGERKKNID